MTDELPIKSSWHAEKEKGRESASALVFHVCVVPRITLTRTDPDPVSNSKQKHYTKYEREQGILLLLKEESFNL